MKHTKAQKSKRCENVKSKRCENVKYKRCENVEYNRCENVAYKRRENVKKINVPFENPKKLMVIIFNMARFPLLLA